MTITLATLHLATPQQVFDQVAAHLRSQGRRSLYDGTCAYRGANGLMCAAGCLMSDSEYHQKMDENMTWKALIEENYVGNCHADLITALQLTHDAVEPNRWEEDLALVAARFKLEYKEVA